MLPKLDDLLRDHDGLEGLAGELGQHDHNAKAFEGAANDNATGPNWRGDLFLILLIATIVGAEVFAFFG